MAATDFAPQILPGWVRSLAAGVPRAPEGAKDLPTAPRGTLFALGAGGGWAVPPRRFELLFGRKEDDVHIPLGVDDRQISRRQGRLTCHGEEWTVRNDGRLPMVFPGNSLLLSGQERVISASYTPVFVGDPEDRVHSLEIRLIGGKRTGPDCDTDDETSVSTVHRLSGVERLVLTSMARRYLLDLPRPRPQTWQDIANDLNRSSATDREWNDRSVARVVAKVRERLSTPGYPRPVAGLLRDDSIGEPLGNALNDNLVREMLQSATLTPNDLRLLED
ncbi:hypothetical protein LX16_2198 [Stackebrandtia albiflava]|uniref:FHA domain-containing protein n=1 Tax=Stackebrandtia albiflava TaxID=406432 RepID=A0A562V0M8_9ACTN|nr:FHA domain-containing protein [Stackebrandtia albiflava]TWJ11476.1 hypothetical protein LX16_2198 [Stackebrandtia albiflava]